MTTTMTAPLAPNNLPLWFGVYNLLEEDYCYINYLYENNRDNAYYFIQQYDGNISVYLLLKTADDRYEVHSSFDEENEFKNYDCSAVRMFEECELKFGEFGRLFN